MKKYFLMAVVTVTLMTQFADAGIFARLRARRQGAAAPAAAAPTDAGKATPAPTAATPAPAPAPASPMPPSPRARGAADQVSLPEALTTTSVRGHEFQRPEHALFVGARGKHHVLDVPHADTVGFATTTRREENAAASDAVHSRLPSKGIHYDAPAEVSQWEVQMHETARELSGQLDAKLSLLQSLIVEANRAAERLENALEKASSTKDEPQAPLQPVEDDRRSLGSSGEVAAGIDLTAVGAEPAQGDRGRRRDEIYQLADYGFALDEIARRVGSPVGEVELVLSLRGK